jgi:hypothetical protein
MDRQEMFMRMQKKVARVEVANVDVLDAWSLPKSSTARWRNML